MSNLFADFFNSVYTPPILLPAYSRPEANLPFAKLTFSTAQVENILSTLNVDKGPGSDKISNYFLKRTSHSLAYPLTILFNASLHQGHFPSKFKETIVHPVFKSSDPSQVENYRPISILNAFSKVFE